MARITEVVSTKRSAHHAFIRWLCEHTPTPLTFFNNVDTSRNPRLRVSESYNVVAPPPSSAWAAMLRRPPHDLILNFEGKLPESIDHFNATVLAGTEGEVHRVYFVRDPVNTLASLAKRVERVDFEAAFHHFRQLLGFEGIVARLAGARAERGARVVVMTAWLTDAAHRAALAEAFGLAGSDLPTGVTSYGGGSSFGGMGFDPATGVATLFERWKAMADDPLFLAAFTDPAAVAAMTRYLEAFSARERVTPAIVAELAERSRRVPDALAIRRRYLDPLRQNRGLLARMERTRYDLPRKVLRGALRARSALRAAA